MDVALWIFAVSGWALAFLDFVILTKVRSRLRKVEEQSAANLAAIKLEHARRVKNSINRARYGHD